MSTPVHKLQLSGCSPTPLAHYLKALGVLRILAEQADPCVTGWWQNDSFWIESTLSNDHIVDFFQTAYVPAAIVVPWSGADFFDAKRECVREEFQAKWPVSSSNDRPTGCKAIEAMLVTAGQRLAEYRDAILLIFHALKSLNIESKNDFNSSPQNKSRLLVQLRNILPDNLLDWMDVTGIVNDLGASDLTLNCLLGGGGGSDGNAHFSDNYMQCLWMVFSEFDFQRKGPTKSTDGLPFSTVNALRQALFGELLPATFIKNLSPALFNPTAVGGANSGNGFNQDSASNPWDYIFMLEGAFLFAGGASRRFDPSSSAESAFPFIFGVSPVGPAGINEGERGPMSREAWLPIWERPTNYKETKMIFSEAKVQTSRRRSQSGLDVARAISNLGVDRGIQSFQRIAILRGRIGGDNYFTTCSLGRFRVKASPGVEEILAPLDTWLERFRRAATGKNAPARAGRALRRLESSILNLCQRGDAADVQATLIALGEAEASVAISRELRNGSLGSGLSPLPLLSIDWLLRANDGSCEFRLASALASVAHSEVGPIRRHLEPIHLDPQNLRSKFPKWADEATDPAIVWGSGSLIKNLCRVLLRRLVDAERGNAEDMNRLAPLGGRLSAPISDISAFIDGVVDEQKLESLFKALCLLEFPFNREELISLTKALREKAGPQYQSKLPNVGYSLLKLCFLPFPIHNKLIVLDPRIARTAASSEGHEASKLAVRRLRADGFISAIDIVPLTRAQSERIAAALMFPIGVHAAYLLASLVLRDSANTRRNAELDTDGSVSYLVPEEVET